MTPTISIAISSTYVTVDEFSCVSGMNPHTVKKYISEGKLPIRKKKITGKYERSTTLINMTALTFEGAKSETIVPSLCPDPKIKIPFPQNLKSQKEHVIN